VAAQYAPSDERSKVWSIRKSNGTGDSADMRTGQHNARQGGMSAAEQSPHTRAQKGMASGSEENRFDIV
jgi:hypothetical protein